jgi:hypothetical protein
VYCVLCTKKFVEGLGGRPNCIGRSVIDDPVVVVDLGLYSNIGSAWFFKCKFDLKTSFIMTN